MIDAQIIHTDNFAGINWYVLKGGNGQHYGAMEDAFRAKKGYSNVKLWVGRKVVIKALNDSKYKRIATEVLV